MKFGINCGHTKSGAGSGAVGIINESVETRNVGYALMNLLKAGGHTVIDCTIDKATIQNAYLSQAVKLANNQTLDYFISIHFNAGGGRGTEVYTYEGRQFTDALEVCQNISALGFKNRGVKAGTGLYVIRKTKAKSMLIEVCFVDTDDANLYKQLGVNKIAEAIYKAITDTNVTVVKTEGATSQPSNASANTSASSSASNLYDSWVANLQTELNRQGFRDSSGNILKVDGINGSKTLSACPTVKKGAKGNITKLIQQRLNSVGFSLSTDGDFGTKTYNAVITFQKNRGLIQDGIVGKNTWTWLLKGTKM